MFTAELLTPIGIIPLSFEQELKDLKGEVKKFVVPFVFKTEEEVIVHIEKKLKDKKIYGYHIKSFNPINDGKKL
jgi:hypothetical protein